MIKGVTIQYFKAIKQCNNLQLQPFTVFIGNNGSGKSSVLEALKMLQTAVTEDLQQAFQQWKGIDKVRHFSALHNSPVVNELGFIQKEEPVTIQFDCTVAGKLFQYSISINLDESGDYYVVEHEELLCDGEPLITGNVVSNDGNNMGQITPSSEFGVPPFTYAGNRLLLSFRDGNPVWLSEEIKLFQEYVINWQFLYLNAHEMGEPYLQNRLTRKIKLNYDGSNVAEYLVWLRATSSESFESLIKKMQFVLPYMQQIQPRITEVVNREIDLLMYENNEKSRPLPGWLLSSGTLRILALLAMFNTPEKPSVLFIDEIENGLDPRTIGLLLSQIESAFSEKEMQVIVTTHSPYLLDMVALESIIVTEKEVAGSTYTIPDNDESLTKWKEKFSPGKLYTMGKLTQ